MIWRLMASMLTLTDAGSASLTSDQMDWPTQQQCEQIKADFYKSPPPQTVDGKRVTIKISATCVLVQEVVDVEPPPPGVMMPMHPLPPGVVPDPRLPYVRPEYRVMPRFMSDGSPMLAPPCGGVVPCEYEERRRR